MSAREQWLVEYVIVSSTEVKKGNFPAGCQRASGCIGKQDLKRVKSCIN